MRVNHIKACPFNEIDHNLSYWLRLSLGLARLLYKNIRRFYLIKELETLFHFMNQFNIPQGFGVMQGMFGPCTSNIVDKEWISNINPACLLSCHSERSEESL